MVILTASSRTSADGRHVEEEDPPLTLTNWPYWSHYWQSLLYIHGMWDFVDPDNTDGPDVPPTIDDTNDTDDSDGSGDSNDPSELETIDLRAKFIELHERFFSSFFGSSWFIVNPKSSFRQKWIQLRDFFNRINLPPKAKVKESDGSTSWPRWSNHWSDLLHMYGIWDFVDPDKNDEPDGLHTNCNPDAMYRKKKYIDLHSRMLSSLDENCILVIEPDSSMRQKWIKLKELCHKGAEEAKVELFAKFDNIFWKRVDTPGTFAARFLDAYLEFDVAAPDVINRDTAASILLGRMPNDSTNWGDGSTTWGMMKLHIPKDCTNISHTVRWIEDNCPAKPRDWSDNTIDHALFRRRRKQKKDFRCNNNSENSRSRWRPYSNRNGRKTHNSLSRSQFHGYQHRQYEQ